jgi:phospholipid/cholesterol/gamma-HCH transport system substrate-binding protein
MKNNRRRTIRLGMFIAGGVLLFIMVIYLIGGKQNMFTSSMKITTVFNDVKGLQEGATVRFTGIDVGAVNRLEILTDSTVLVEISLDRKVTKFIKKDSRATIASQGLMGNKLIIIMPGAADRPSIEEGDNLLSVEPVEIDDIIREIQISGERISIVSANLISITDKMERGEGIFGKIFTDTSFAYNLSQTSRNIRILSEQVNRGEGFLGKLLAESEFSAELDSTAVYVTSIARNIEEITYKIDRGEGLIGQMTTDTTLTYNLYHAGENLNKATFNMEKMTANLITFTETMNSGQGMVHKMLVDSAFADSLDVALQNLNSTLIELRQASTAIQQSGMVRAFSRKARKEEEKARREKAEDQTERPENQ